VAVGLSAPGLGGRLNPSGITADVVVWLLFLGTGLTLPSEAIASGLRKVKLHLLTQTFIFVIYPLTMVGLVAVIGDVLSPGLRVGFLALSVLPTTISSCIVFTHGSGGNSVGTAFNAAVANASGALVSPLLLTLLLRGSSLSIGDIRPGHVIGELALLMVLPLVFGQVIHRLSPKLVKRAAKPVKIASNIAILFLVLVSVAKSASTPGFVEQAGDALVPLAFLATYHLGVVGLAFLIARLAKLDRADRIAFLYAAPQKTLAMGTPLIAVYFADAPELLGAALLPLVVYHPWQLVVAGVLKSLPAMKGDREPTTGGAAGRGSDTSTGNPADGACDPSAGEAGYHPADETADTTAAEAPERAGDAATRDTPPEEEQR
jgi:solute carrier family 10 (sodium/bile acid cotransporter), member 7